MSLERELEELLEVEKFEPPAEFRERALWNDPAIYEEAAADPEAWWMRQATELLDWDTEPSQGLDDSNPPFYKWFEDGRLNASAQCLDRHGAAGNGGRGAPPPPRRGPAPRPPARRQRAQGPRGRKGGRGRDLPADDPRGRRRDARLRAD